MAAGPDRAEHIGAARAPGQAFRQEHGQERELGLAQERDQELELGLAQEPGLDSGLAVSAARVVRGAAPDPRPAICRASSACQPQSAVWEGPSAALRRAQALEHQE